MEKNIELELLPLLPGIAAEDGCCARLADALQGNKKLLRAHLERGAQSTRLCLHYDPQVVSLAELQRLAERTGAEIAGRYRHELVTIQGMDCSDCAMVIEHSVSRLEGVISASVAYPGQKMQVEYDSTKINRAAIEQRIRALGYQVPLGAAQSWAAENRKLLSSLAAGLFLFTGWLGQQFFAFPYFLSLAFYLAAYGLGGWDISRSGLRALRQREFDTDLLMVLAALGAAALVLNFRNLLVIFGAVIYSTKENRIVFIQDVSFDYRFLARN